jgi:uncharacterized membrane protein
VQDLQTWLKKIMEIFDQMHFFSALDGVALFVLIGAWAYLGHIIEYPPKRRPSTSVIMTQYRLQWMEQMITRQPRIFDASILGSLRQSTAFFGSACLIAIGAGLAALSNPEQFRGVAEDLALDAPDFIWEVKLLLALFFVTNAFLKFIWSNRLFGYCGVVMASVPNKTDSPDALPRAKKAGQLNITAARAFNRGLRGIYFALASLGWLLGPVGLLVTTLITTTILLRREFASTSRATLLETDV